MLEELFQQLRKQNKMIIELYQYYLPACLASFFVWAIPSNICPLTSTAIVKKGRWDGPVCATSLYSMEGLRSCNNISAFFDIIDELSLLLIVGVIFDRFFSCISWKSSCIRLNLWGWRIFGSTKEEKKILLIIYDNLFILTWYTLDDNLMW